MRALHCPPRARQGEAGALWGQLLPGEPPTCGTLRSGRKGKQITLVQVWLTASRQTVTKAALSSSSKTPHGVVIQTGPWAHTAKPLTLQRLPRGGSSTTSPHPTGLPCPALAQTWMRFLILKVVLQSLQGSTQGLGEERML